MGFFNDYSYTKIAEMRGVALANEGIGDRLLRMAARIRERRHLPSRIRYLGC